MTTLKNFLSVFKKDIKNENIIVTNPDPQAQPAIPVWSQQDEDRVTALRHERYNENRKNAVEVFLSQHEDIREGILKKIKENAVDDTMGMIYSAMDPGWNSYSEEGRLYQKYREANFTEHPALHDYFDEEAKLKSRNIYKDLLNAHLSKSIDKILLVKKDV